MLLWTMKPIEMWNELKETGVYHCDAGKFSMPEFRLHYDWLVEQMKKRIGAPPTGVELPVWAWYMKDGKRKKPDLRSERWAYGPGDEDYVCIEVDVDESRVLLSDFDAWSVILCDGLLSASEQEDEVLETQYEKLSEAEQIKFKRENWERVFDISPCDNGWINQGSWVQATFWELWLEDVRNVRFFRTGKLKRY